MEFAQWNGFVDGDWKTGIDVRGFIQSNYTPYTGDASFLAKATPKTEHLMQKLRDLQQQEREKGGVLDIDTTTVSSLCNYQPGYLDKENELIVGLQTDAPLKRGVNPFGGIRMAREACAAYGYQLSDTIEEYFKYRTTHNDGVFRAYTPEMKAARHCALLTGLPDAYGRGRIIGDYRRVALYGIDALIAAKQQDKLDIGMGNMDTESIRLTEELFEQISFLKKMKEMASMYSLKMILSSPAYMCIQNKQVKRILNVLPVFKLMKLHVKSE